MWIKIKQGTYQIKSFNKHQPNIEEDVFELWVTKADNKTMCVAVSTDQAKIETLEEMLNYAVENNIPSVDLVNY